MDKPQVDRIEGIPPAIAIDQTNPVRTSRSTVGTMTELADYLKLLFARAATLYCRGCGAPRPPRHADSRSTTRLAQRARGRRRSAAGDHVPGRRARRISPRARCWRCSSGRATRASTRGAARCSTSSPTGCAWAAREARARGRGVGGRAAPGPTGAWTSTRCRRTRRARAADRRAAPEPAAVWRFSTGLHCPDCDIDYPEPRRRCSRSIRRWAPARPAAASGA